MITGGHTFLALRQIERETKGLLLILDFPSSLKTIAYEKGFTISQNRGNANCMFIALSEQLGRAEIEISHEELRQSVVQYLKKNPKMVSVLIIFLKNEVRTSDEGRSGV